MKIAILGYGNQGRAALEYWQSLGHDVTVCDANPDIEVPQGVSKQVGPNYLQNLSRFDLLVRTPILHPRQITEANADSPDILEKTTSVTNEFFRVCPTKNIIGVTGTKGKGTTSTLIARLLEANGKTVHLGGNIGTPPLDLLKNNISENDWVVLELANFQLIDLKYSPHISVCVMVNEEHLDWHTDFEEYLTAKQQLFVHQNPQDIAIYYAENEYSSRIASASPGKIIPYMTKPGAEVNGGQIVIQGQSICQVSELRLLGKHNWQNVCAALTAVWQVTQDVRAIRSTLTTFEGLPHRLELVRAVDDVSYYNDSFASGPGATQAAIDAIETMKVLIIGGHDRMLDLKELAGHIKANAVTIRKVLLIGASSQRMAEALRRAGFDNFELSQAKTMPEMVSQARNLTQNGDAVLLSPGFASFDMFKNFEDRGVKFKDSVNSL